MLAPTLTGRIHQAASHSHTGVTFVAGDVGTRVSWSDLYTDALGYASVLQQRGIGPGSHVAIMGPTTRPLVTAIEAVWLAGATTVVLPLPMRLASIDEFIEQTRQRIGHADVSLLLIDPEFAPFVPLDEMPPVLTFPELTDGDAAMFVAVEPPVDSLAVLQFTSGSTAEPKGVMLPHRTVCANLDAIATAADLVADVDVMVSWLPLYHDMGLVGFLILPMSNGVELVLGAPQDFLGDPARWMRWMSTYRGTATAGPNFAWVLATRALARSETLDLSRMRIALNGAEPVDCAAVDRFIDAAVPHGLRPGAVYPAFGMAELVIAGTFPKPMQGLRVDRVDRDALELERRAVPCTNASARDLAILGRAVPGLSLRIVDPTTGEVRGEREVGELQITGTSVTTGYYKHPEANDALFDGEWLRTGDLAYLVDGEMVMCGRIKDVIIIGGRNIFPDEVERAVGDVDGVRAGNVVAFGVDSARNKEAIVIVAETNRDDAHDVARNMAQRVIETVGLPAKDIVLVGGGTLPKTSSGKLQRSLCRTLYSTNTLLDIRWQSHAIRR
ncbi:MAG TPA: AMP-binding protein [Acidimicrobiales bacterium]|nr:AMP-binding protein [Acidimicrobiales bacterium]